MPRNMQHVRLLTIKGSIDECVNAAAMMWGKTASLTQEYDEPQNLMPPPSMPSMSQGRELLSRPRGPMSPSGMSSFSGMGGASDSHFSVGSSQWTIVDSQFTNQSQLSMNRSPNQQAPNGYAFVGEQAREMERNLGPEVKLTVWVPNAKVGQLIGKKGAGIQSIIEKSKGAHISFAKEDETQFISIGDKGPCALRPVTIKGKTSQ